MNTADGLHPTFGTYLNSKNFEKVSDSSSLYHIAIQTWFGQGRVRRVGGSKTSVC